MSFLTWAKHVLRLETPFDHYEVFQEARRKCKVGTSVDSHKTIEICKQVTSKLNGGELKYFIVTLQYKHSTRTEAWMIEHGNSVLQQFAWLQQLQSGELALINAWETTKEIYDEIRWNDEARRSLL